MWRVLGYATLALVAVAAILVFLAWRAPEPPNATDALASLPTAQREALAALATQAGMSMSDWRVVFDSSGKLFAHEVNRRAIVVDNGQLTALSLQHADTVQQLDLTVWPQLRALDLRGAGLRDWAALQGLSHLTHLTHLNLSQTALGDPPPKVLPLHLQDLFLARTQLTQATELRHLTGLKTVDVSGTRLTHIDPLLALSLEHLNASHTLLQTLPAQLPAQGAWKLNATDTPLLQPSGYRATWPFETWVVSSTARDGDVAQGDIGAGQLDIRGRLQVVDKAIAIPLPRTTDGNLADVEMEIGIATGRARIWLEAPKTLFASPWFTEGKVEGFGLLRQRGYVFAEVQPGPSVALQGRLRLTTESRHYEQGREHRQESNAAPDWMRYHFFVEPLDQHPVTGLHYRVRHVPTPLPSSRLKPL